MSIPDVESVGTFSDVMFARKKVAFHLLTTGQFSSPSIFFKQLIKILITNKRHTYMTEPNRDLQLHLSLYSPGL